MNATNFHTHAVRQSINELRLPKLDFAIIGGGMAGVAIGSALVSRLEEERARTATENQTAEPNSILNVKNVRMLVGGKSLAYAPVDGDFGEYLTLAGSDRYRRDHTLHYFRSNLKEQFDQIGFHFEVGCFATKIRDTGRGTFHVDAVQDEKLLSFESRKLAVALGHALRVVPSELRDYVIQGGGGLCQRLNGELLQGAPSHAACLDRVLSRFKPIQDGTLQIGVVGLGATTIEVLKILESLLDKSHGAYRTADSKIPIKLIVYDAQVFPRESLIDGLCEHVRTYLQYLQVTDDLPNAGIRKAEIAAFKEEAEARIRRLAAKGHIDVVPQRFEWTSLHVEDHVVVASDATGRTTGLSCVIDCAPFIEGISTSQKQILDGLPALRFSPASAGGWKTEIEDETARQRLALLGAAFSTKREWGAQNFEQEAQKAIATFFPTSTAKSVEAMGPHTPE